MYLQRRRRAVTVASHPLQNSIIVVICPILLHKNHNLQDARESMMLHDMIELRLKMLTCSTSDRAAFTAPTRQMRDDAKRAMAAQH